MIGTTFSGPSDLLHPILPKWEATLSTSTSLAPSLINLPGHVVVACANGRSSTASRIFTTSCGPKGIILGAEYMNVNLVWVGWTMIVSEVNMMPDTGVWVVGR